MLFHVEYFLQSAFFLLFQFSAFEYLPFCSLSHIFLFLPAQCLFQNLIFNFFSSLYFPSAPVYQFFSNSLRLLSFTMEYWFSVDYVIYCSYTLHKIWTVVFEDRLPLFLIDMLRKHPLDFILVIVFSKGFKCYLKASVRILLLPLTPTLCVS